MELKSENNAQLKQYHLVVMISVLSLVLVLPKLIFLTFTLFNDNLPYPDSVMQSVNVLIVILMTSSYLLVSCLKQNNYPNFLKNISCLLKALTVMYCLGFLSDVCWLVEKGWVHKESYFLEQAIVSLILENRFTHFIFLSFLFILFAVGLYFNKTIFTFEMMLNKLQATANIIALLALFWMVTGIIIYWHSTESLFSQDRLLITFLIDLFLTLQILFLVAACIFYKRKYLVKEKLSALILKQGKMHALMTAIASILFTFPALIETHKLKFTPLHIFYYFKMHAILLSKILIPLYTLLVAFYQIKKLLSKVNRAQTDKTSGEFGSADFASQSDLESAKLYDNHASILSGRDETEHDIFLPLKNKLTISPQGGGKTSCSTVNVLLSHSGNAFVFDIKGELWAITARHRQTVFNKEVIVLDPYQITKSEDFAKGKSPSLLKDYCLNPFDWIPENQGMRDRMINAFASSFIINEGGTATHFDDNAKILIRGYIDYLMQARPKEERNLEALYKLLSEHQDNAKETFQQMGYFSGRSEAASNQISRVGTDEKGSILSTSYRQIDWMSDVNIQSCLSHSNFDLEQFIKGNMDIYVVLPEDQIKEHQRFVRMLLSLMMSFIVQTDPSDLPEQKMLFLLDELAQLGYCPDVEQAIEVLRARKLVVWTVFQTLSQIKLYKKPDLFMGAPIKQVFTNDDVETMQWIQALGGKKTILTKTLSNNEGDSRAKMQLIGGSVSTGEGESIQETGVDLIHINQIRELKEDEQFIFMHGMRPIKCKKVRYFEHSFFRGKFDVNPLEVFSSIKG